MDIVKLYDTIAASFNKTRFSKWDSVSKFIRSLSARSRLGDIGCGNGKYFDVRTDIEIMACDASEKQVDISWDRVYEKQYTHVEVYQADVRNIPIISDFLDAAICIAVIHHLPSYDERFDAIVELLRIVRPGGSVFFTFWALEGIEERKETKKWRKQCNHGDYLVPWTMNDQVYLRFYHLMDTIECKRLQSDLHQRLKYTVNASYVLDMNNWNFTVQKY